MIWIRIFITVILFLMAIYYAMLIFQCFTPWFNMTNRKITFGRCIVPFYYWIAPSEEKEKEKNISEEIDEYEERLKILKEKRDENLKH